jgi:hypothetical protein
VSNIVVIASNFPTPTPTTQTFEDVLPGSTFYVYDERIAGYGIVGGYPCGGPGEPCVPPANRPYFRPNNNVIRGQAAKIIDIARVTNPATPTTTPAVTATQTPEVTATPTAQPTDTPAVTATATVTGTPPTGTATTTTTPTFIQGTDVPRPTRTPTVFR